VAVLPVRYYQLYKVIINVTDINDHAPIFHRRSTFVLNISESAQPGTQFSLPVADDRDSQQYAVVEYRLEPAEMQRIFTLQVATEADGSQQVCCRVTYLLTWHKTCPLSHEKLQNCTIRVTLLSFITSHSSACTRSYGELQSFKTTLLLIRRKSYAANVMEINSSLIFYLKQCNRRMCKG